MVDFTGAHYTAAPPRHSACLPSATDTRRRCDSAVLFLILACECNQTPALENSQPRFVVSFLEGALSWWNTEGIIPPDEKSIQCSVLSPPYILYEIMRQA